GCTRASASNRSAPSPPSCTECARPQRRRRLHSAASAVAGLRLGQVAQELLHLATVLLRRTAQPLVPSRDEPAQGRVGRGREILIALDVAGGRSVGGDG